MQASILFIFRLIERKTLYDSRVYSHDFPQHRATQYAQPEKQTKEPCINGGEYPDNRFLSSNKRKTEKEKEMRKFTTFKTPRKDNTKLCIIFLIFISKVKPNANW